MKFRNVGQVLLALVVSVGLGIGVTSCTNSYTVGYLYVTGSQYNQISGFNIKTIYTAIRSGDLKSHLKPPGFRDRFIRHQDLQAYIDAQPVG